MTYNGWTNWETWNTYLWITNDRAQNARRKGGTMILKHSAPAKILIDERDYTALVEAAKWAFEQLDKLDTHKDHPGIVSRMFISRGKRNWAVYRRFVRELDGGKYWVNYEHEILKEEL